MDTKVVQDDKNMTPADVARIGCEAMKCLNIPRSSFRSQMRLARRPLRGHSSGRSPFLVAPSFSREAK